MLEKTVVHFKPYSRDTDRFGWYMGSEVIETSKAASAMTFKQKEWMALQPSTWYSQLSIQIKLFHDHCGWSKLLQNVV